MRKYFLDNIRYFTIIVVVLFHIIYMYNGQSVPVVIGAFHENQIQDVFQYIVYPWIMILLYIISGISSYLYLRKNNNYFYDRTIKLLVPSTIGLLVFGWVLGYYNMLINGSFSKIPKTINKFILYIIMSLAGVGTLWFNQVLWINSVLLILIRKFEKNKIYIFMSNISLNPFYVLVIGFGLLASSRILNTPIVLYRFGVFGYAFFIGYFIFSKENNINYLERNYIFFLILSFVFGVAYTCRYYGENYSLHEIFGSLLSIGYAWFSCLAIIGIGKKYFDKKYTFTEFMSKKSYGIYVFHYLCLTSTGYYLRKYTNLYPFIQYIIVGLSCFVGSILLFEIMSRIPIIRWCVLGLTNKAKQNVNLNLKQK